MAKVQIIIPNVGGGGSGGVSVHNDLTGIQGGSTGEYFHLTEGQLENSQIAYTHSQIIEGNPHNVTAEDLGLENVISELDSKVDKVLGSRLINSSEIINLSNQSGINTGDETTSSMQSKRPLKTVVGQSLEGAGNVDISTSNVSEGSNLYFTTARVLATLLSGISFATGGAIVSTDSVLIAFGKIQKNITDIFTALDLKLTKVSTGSQERVYGVGVDNVQKMISTKEQFVSDADIIVALEAITTTIATISVTGKTMYKGQMYVSTSPDYLYVAFDDNLIIRK